MEILEEIGLTPTQAKVYLALLKLGSATAHQVIKESGLHRSPVYDALEKLQRGGLVGVVIREFKKHFQAAAPEKLYSYLEEKRSGLEKAMPQLKKLESQKKEEIQGTVYLGKEGLKTIHAEMLKEGKDIYVLGAKGLIFQEMEYFMPHFEKERLKKGMKWKILWDPKAERISKKLMEAKVLPQEAATEGVVNIFGNKTAIVLWKERYPQGFVIESKEIASSFRKWFELCYNGLKPSQ